MRPENPNTVLVNILDKDYQVACPPEHQAALANAAQHLDHQMRKIRESGKVIGLDRIAVMAALNITHDLLQTKHQKDPSEGAQDHLRRLNNKLDSALQRFKQLEI